MDLSEAERYCSEPAPLEQVRRAFDRLDPGERLEVRSRIREHVWAVRAWSARDGIQVDTDDMVDGMHRIVIRRGFIPQPAG